MAAAFGLLGTALLVVVFSLFFLRQYFAFFTTANPYYIEVDNRRG
jgi:hypothetical protein